MLCPIVHGGCCSVPDVAGIVLNTEGFVPELESVLAACRKGKVLSSCMIRIFFNVFCPSLLMLRN